MVQQGGELGPYLHPQSFHHASVFIILDIFVSFISKTDLVFSFKNVHLV